MASLHSLNRSIEPWARWLVSLAPYAGARSVRITSVRRTRAQQTRLWENYLAGRSLFPAAPPGASKHEYGLAWDMVTEPAEALAVLGSWWRSVGGTWSPRDPIHFEV